MHQSAKPLLLVTALIEISTGFFLMLTPSLLATILLGVTAVTPVGIVVAHLAGAALVSLGVNCFLMRNEGHSASMRRVLITMVIYNVGAVAALIDARIEFALYAMALWPAALLHAAMAVWCILCI